MLLSRACRLGVALMVAMLVLTVRATPQASAGVAWDRVVTIDPASVKTEQQFYDLLKQQDAPTAGYANWFTGRWPNISFIGGMVMGNVSDQIEFFYQMPFRWSTRVLDYVMEPGGRKFGIRTTIKPYGGGTFPARQSFLLWYRCDVLLADYHPSYILVNGRRMWDSKKHPLLGGKILVPFWQEQAGNPVVDFVVDLDYTPEVKGLAFRMFNTLRLAKPGVKVSLKGASETPEPSPADSEQRFAFGVFSSGYDFWSDRGVPIADLKKMWKPNFRPTYAVDEISLSPFIGEEPAEGPYHDFMVTYGGCNILGTNPGPAILKATASYACGMMAKPFDAESTRKALQLDPHLEAHWFGGEEGLLAGDERADDRDRLAHLKAESDRVEAAKQQTGAPERVRMIWEPFPPALSAAYEYERGRDILVLKNEEDPQYNILMSMARGAGRSMGKPFGFYWEQTHYPFPSLNFKLQACLLYYLSGGSWIGAEAENAPSFANGSVAEWVLPYVKALRFAMVHPARGTPIIPIGICWGYGDRWWAPYNPFGQMDTFQRSLSYDHATKKITSEPAFVKPLPWMPQDRNRWNFETTGHLPYFIDHVQEMKGYDLLDVFFPQYGDAFTAHIARLLTGTPYGPVDFVYTDRASVETLRTYGVLAFLGHAEITSEIGKKLIAAAEFGSSVVLGAQHLHNANALLPGIQIPAGDPVPIEGAVAGLSDIYHGAAAGRFVGRVYRAISEGWETVAWVGTEQKKTPLVVRKTIGKGIVYVYLGEWIADGGDIIRPILRALGERAAPLRFAPTDDQMEYMAYRKGAGAWVALFNHGGIVIGSAQIRPPRAIPPEPLGSVVKGPWKGEIEIRTATLGLDPTRRYALYEVQGIDGPAFEQVIAGQAPFTVKEIPSEWKAGILHAHVTVDKRAELVLAPPGQGNAVFFGKP